MPMLDDIVLSKAQHIMIYGEPFTGKSTLAATVAELGFKVLWITLDNGYGILKNLSPEARKRVEVVVLPDTKDNPVGIKSMLKIMTGAPVEVCDLHGEVGCVRCRRDNLPSTKLNLGALGPETVVVIDPLSMLADSAMQHAIKRSILAERIDANKIKETDPDFFKPGYEEFMLVQFMMNKVLTNVKASRYHCICITHVIESQQEDNTRKLVPHTGSSPYSINSPKFFDHVILARIVNGKFTFGSTARFLMQAVAGSRNGIIMEEIDPPTLKLFFDGSIPQLGSYGDNLREEVAQNTIIEKTLDNTDVPLVRSILAASPATLTPKEKLALFKNRKSMQ